MKHILVLVFSLLALPAQADEETWIKFLCNNPGAAIDVIHRSDDLILGLSPLPSGCAWVQPVMMGTVQETVTHIDVAGNKIARIARVVVDGKTGFSGGLVELLS